MGTPAAGQSDDLARGGIAVQRSDDPAHHIGDVRGLCIPVVGTATRRPLIICTGSTVQGRLPGP